MAKAGVKILKLEFDFTDDDVTTMRITFRGEGDVPIHLLGGVREKTFPARLSVIELLDQEIATSQWMLWP